MGRLISVDYDPDMLDLAYDDFDEVDESWESYGEYQAYIPDKIADLKSLNVASMQACEKAESDMRKAADHTVMSSAAAPVAWMLLYDEAISSTRIEGYHVRVPKMLTIMAERAHTHNQSIGGHSAEATALDAVEALKDIMSRGNDLVTTESICEINEIITRDDDSADICGQLRDRPVFIGGTSLFDANFVPLPPDYVEEYMDDLTRFVNDRNSGMSPIARAAIAHAQLVTIHPFADGNGRTARTLMQQMLQSEGPGRGIVMPVSATIASRRESYIDALQPMQNAYRENPADPNQFVSYIANACSMTSQATLLAERRIESIMGRWASMLPKCDADTIKVIEAFATMPVMTRAILETSTGKNQSTTLDAMVDNNILRTRAGYAGTTVYVADDMVQVLEDMCSMRRASRQPKANMPKRQMPDMTHTGTYRDAHDEDAPDI